MEYTLSHIFYRFHFTLYGAVHCFDITDLGTEQIPLLWQYVHRINTNTGLAKTNILKLKNYNSPHQRKYSHGLKILYFDQDEKVEKKRKWVIHETSAHKQPLLKIHTYRVKTDLRKKQSSRYLTALISMWCCKFSVWFTQHWISLRGKHRHLKPQLWSQSPASHFWLF